MKGSQILNCKKGIQLKEKSHIFSSSLISSTKKVNDDNKPTYIFLDYSNCQCSCENKY